MKRSLKVGLIVLAVLLWGAGQGFVLVEANEVAVVLTWGEVSHVMEPGLHYLLPPPIQRVYRVKPREVRKLAFSHTRLGAAKLKRPTALELQRLSKEERSRRMKEYMLALEQQRRRPPPYKLTGDENLITIDAALQYRVSSPEGYLFSAEDMDRLLHGLALSTTVLEVATRSVKDLTKKRRTIGVAIRERLQAQVKALGLGVTILSVNLLAVEPPAGAQRAFKAVSNAWADRSKVVSQARTRVQKVLALARGEADGIKKDAHSYTKERLSEASGEANRFRLLAREHELAPEEFLTRLRLETQQRVLSRSRLILLPPGARPQLKLLPQSSP